MLLLFAGITSAQEKPEAPKPKTETARIADKKFWGVIAVLGAAKTTDAITTERALGRGCREDNAQLFFSRRPSSNQVALSNAAYFAGEVAIAYSLKRFGRKHRWAKPLWLIEPAFQTGQHIDFAAHNEGLTCR